MIMTMEERIKNVRENYPDVMTQQEFADALGVCKSIAYRLNRDGKVPYTKRQVRLVRYYQISKDDVIRYIENRYLHTSERYIATCEEYLNELLENEMPMLSVRDIMRIVGVGKTAATRWISRQTVRGVLIMGRYLACKDDMIRFLASPDFQDSHRLPKRAKELVARMEKNYHDLRMGDKSING